MNSYKVAVMATVELTKIYEIYVPSEAPNKPEDTLTVRNDALSLFTDELFASLNREGIQVYKINVEDEWTRSMM